MRDRFHRVNSLAWNWLITDWWPGTGAEINSPCGQLASLAYCIVWKSDIRCVLHARPWSGCDWPIAMFGHKLYRAARSTTTGVWHCWFTVSSEVNNCTLLLYRGINGGATTTWHLSCCFTLGCSGIKSTEELLGATPYWENCDVPVADSCLLITLCHCVINFFTAVITSCSPISTAVMHCGLVLFRFENKNWNWNKLEL